jgi:hypothetical protein
MYPITSTGRPWRLAAAALMGGAALLAFLSGDALLILAVLTGAGGLILLARPAPVAPPRTIGRHATTAHAGRSNEQWQHATMTPSRHAHAARPRMLDAS